jgi:hypothetical protein
VPNSPKEAGLQPLRLSRTRKQKEIIVSEATKSVAPSLAQPTLQP